MIRYQDEMTEFLSFSVRCFGVLMEPLQSYWNWLQLEERTEVRASGAIGLRQSVQQIHGGVFQILNDSEFSEENKRTLLSSVAKAAPSLKIILSTTARSEILTAIEKNGLVRSDGFKGNIESIEAAYEDSECDTLCQL